MLTAPPVFRRPAHPVAAATAVLLSLLLAPAGCGPPLIEPVVDDTSRVASVAVSPATTTLVEGATTYLSAIPRDENGDVLEDRSVSWTSSSPVASVEPNGRVRGESPGTATISATSDGVRGTAEVTVIPAPPAGTTHVLVGAGDIADDGPGAEATARLLDAIGGTVFTTGDHAYPSGSDSDFVEHYQPTWGRHKARTRPCPGNHDYETSGAAGYFAYFGNAAGPSGRGYYSYDVGEWHIISLNSNVDMAAGSPQEQWLRADLASNRRDCTLAYWHHPRFSAGGHGSDEATDPLWRALHEAGAEVVVVGHDHNYQRFGPLDATGLPDPTRGIRQFVVGTGGTSELDEFGTPMPTCEAYSVDTQGVLKLTLRPGSYTWEFIPIAGKVYRDSGSGACHR